MKTPALVARLVDRLVPSVDAHAQGPCYLGTSFCYCQNHKRYQRLCSICEAGGGGWCSPCYATTIAC
jgi:hypothetical protein